jgi:hypothetical protein
MPPSGEVPKWSKSFLAALAECPDVSFAARCAKITRQRAYQARDESAEFAAAWDDAHEQAIDKLAGVAHKRALESSDTLAIFLLKSHRRAVYGDPAKNPPPPDDPPDDPGPTDADGRPLQV